jgi:hypothetical protein
MAAIVYPPPLEGFAASAGDLQQSLAWLRRQLAGGLDAAVGFLRLAHDSRALLALYEELFPCEWAVSRAPLFAPARHCDCYTAREVEFFELVDHHVAPLYLDWLLDGDEERTPYIPVRPLQDYDWVYDETDYADLLTGYQLALALNSEAPEVWAAFCELHHYDPPALPAQVVNGPRLCRLTKATRTPARALSTAVNLTTYDTGNPLLDWHPEMGGPDVLWTSAHLRLLQAWRREAERLQRSVQRFSRWLDGDEKHEKITFCLRLWNLAGVEHDSALAQEAAVSRSAEAEARRFACRMNPYAEQLRLFDAHP